MRVPMQSLCIIMCFVTGHVGSALAQAGSQSNTLQKPATPSPDKPVSASSAAPRVPVQKAGPLKADKPPVVPPQGQLHPHKPSSNLAKPSTSLPPPPAVAPAETAATPKPALPEKAADPEKPDGTPSKLPRFAALRSDDVNMRAGPGTRYRIEWVYRRRDLPVEIEREFDVWRWVRDPDGIQGWVHQATLMGRRNFIVEKANATLRAEASDTAPAVAVLTPGVIGRIRSCAAASEWCSVQAGSYRGYLRRSQFWGLLPGEVLNP